MPSTYFEMELLEKEEEENGGRKNLNSPLWKPLAIGSSLSLIALAMIMLVGAIRSKSFSGQNLTSTGSASNSRIFVDGRWERTCTTVACVHASARILSALDFSTNPCNDFYQFACGGWMAQNSIPRAHLKWTTMSQMELEGQLELKNILETDEPSSDHTLDDGHEILGSAQKKARAFYKSCSDPEGLREKFGAQNLQKLIQRTGGWSISSNNNDGKGNGTSFRLDKWDFERALEVVNNEFDVGAIFKWSVEENDRNSSQYIIKVQPELTRDSSVRQFFQEPPQTKAYVDFMTKVGLLLSGEKSEAEIRQKMKSVWTLKLTIARAYFDYKIMMDKAKTKMDAQMEDLRLMNLTEVGNLCKIISWKKFFNKALTSINYSALTDNHKILVHHPKYFGHLCDLMDTQLRSNPELVNMYLVWRLVETVSRHLSKPFRSAIEPLLKAHVSQFIDEPGAADTFCVTSTTETFGLVLEAMSHRHGNQSDNFRELTHFGPSLARSMMNNVKEAFLQNMEDLKWIDLETKIWVRQKIMDMTFQLGHPNFLLVDKNLDEIFANLDIKEEDYLGNVMRGRQFRMQRNWRKINQTVDKKTFWQPPLTPFTGLLTAIYSLVRNQIFVPAHLFQPPLFHHDFPWSLNFGSVGSILGHELLHGFDNFGIQYDHRGQRGQWWSLEVLSKFESVSKCMDTSSGNFEDNFEMQKYFSENMADVGGLRAAFTAYRQLLKVQGDMRLPQLNLTNDQLFFVSHAQIHCANILPGSSDLLMYLDPYSPPRQRVQWAVKNMKEFYAAFECPSASFFSSSMSMNEPMNSGVKCIVW